MVRFYKIITGGYITAIGTGTGGEEITEQEYNEILNVIRNKPQATATTDYMLKENLTWEAYTLEPVPEPDPTPEEIAEALEAIL